MINRAIGDCQIELKPAEGGQEAADKPKRAGDPTGLPSQAKRESRRISSAGLCGHQNFLIGQVRRRRFIG